MWSVISVDSHSQGTFAYKHKSSLARVCGGVFNVQFIFICIICTYVCVRSGTFLSSVGPWLNYVRVVVRVCVFSGSFILLLMTTERNGRDTNVNVYTRTTLRVYT